MPRVQKKYSIEALELRRVFASDWQNPKLSFDVNASESVSPLDALIVVNQLNTVGSIVLNSRENAVEPFIDTDGDGQLTPMDALGIINVLNDLPEVTIAQFRLRSGQDVNQNGTVVLDSVTAELETVGAEYLEVTREGKSDETIFVSHALTGIQSIALPLVKGENRFQLVVLDPVGRVTKSELVVNCGNIVTEFNATVLNIVRDWSTVSNDPYEGRIVPSQPPRVALNLAAIHLAMYEAMAIGQGLTNSLLGSNDLLVNPLPDVAGVWAAVTVARSLYTDADEQYALDATLLELAPAQTSNEYLISREIGVSVGLKALALVNAQSQSMKLYEKSNELEAWQRTAPDYLPPLLPAWGHRTPFVISDIESVRPVPPPDTNSQEYAEAVDEVMRLGALNSPERTAEQTEIALFWADGGGTATPPGHWNAIAASVVNTSKLSDLVSARTFALLNLAIADAGIATWDSKYYYDLWRPIDAIRKAEFDGNTSTSPDAGWVPLLKTPPFPTYVSGHSAFSGAASAVLTALFGDQFRFSSTTDGHTGLGQRPLASGLIKTRNFESFAAAAEEASKSRIYGGIHFSFDCQIGLQLGQSIGSFVIDRFSAQ